MVSSEARGPHGLAITVACVCLLGWLVSGSQAAEMTAMELFGRFQEVYAKTRALSGEFEEETLSSGQERKASGRVYFAKPNRLRQEYDDPNNPETLAQLIVLDGEYSWSYTPWLNQVTRQQTDPRRSEELVPGIGVDFEHVPERFDLSIEEDEIAAAQNVYLLEMRPKPEAGEDRSSEVLGIWVRGPEWSERAWTPVQFSYASELDNVTTVIRLQKLDLNAEIPADTFQFTPPSGTEIITITADYKSDQ